MDRQGFLAMSGGFVSTALKSKGWHKTIPTCHPDRPHRAKGLCYACYMRRFYVPVHLRVGIAESSRRSRESLHRHTQAYAKRFEATLTKHFCQICGMNYNPLLNKCQRHPEMCGLCHVEYCECHIGNQNLLKTQFKEIRGV
jgi:hypothetical protein